MHPACFHLGSLGWRQIGRCLLLVWCALLSSALWAQSVVFINPGRSDESYWISVNRSMQQAALSLGMRLEIQYTERDRLAPIDIARQIAQRKPADRPDYLIFTNDYGVAPGVLRELEGSGVAAFMAFNGIRQDSRALTGNPRERYSFWLGSLEPNAWDAGYLSAKELINKAKTMPQLLGMDGRLHMLVFAGDRSTPSSVARNEGMRKAIQEAGVDLLLDQEVYSDWSRDKALQQARVLYKRYPDARLIWAGNDEMAFGAMQAWREKGGQPGQDGLFSAINSSDEILKARASGEVSALTGGHFLLGAWALVMLFDYAHGIDFVSEGLEQVRPMFVSLDASSALQFRQTIVEGRVPLNFRQFSKHFNPKLTKYDFNPRWLLSAMPR